MKFKLASILICGVFLVSLVSAIPDLELSLKPHYYRDGREVIYTPDIEISALSLEIIGTNNDPSFRILNLSIADSYPLILKEALLEDTVEMLRIKQTKTLWISQIVDVIDLAEGNQTNVSFWVGVEGIHERTGEELYEEAHLKLVLPELVVEENDSFLMSWGERIWEGSPVLGILLFGGGGLLVVFLLWRYKAPEYFNRWREKQERKRIEKRKREEGYY